MSNEKENIIRGLYLTDDEGNETRSLEFTEHGGYNLKLYGESLRHDHFDNVDDKIKFIDSILKTIELDDDVREVDADELANVFNSHIEALIEVHTTKLKMELNHMVQRIVKHYSHYEILKDEGEAAFNKTKPSNTKWTNKDGP